jgi:hypothetical protein
MQKLFKYYSINNYSLSALTNGLSWYSETDYFNDPFDTKIIDNEYLKIISSSKEKILCLSGVNDNILMWSHYADSHKGFCVEFTDYNDDDISQLKIKGIFPKVENDKLTIVRNARPVEYLSTAEINEYTKDIPTDKLEFERLYSSLNPVDKISLLEKIQKTSFIKHEDWKYEKEYRLINTSRNLIRFPGNITAIYFGMKMNSIDKRMLCISLSSIIDKNIKFFQMHRPLGKYSLEPREFDNRKDLNDLGDIIVY